MSPEALLILLFILLMALAIPYMFRANFQTRLQKCKTNNDYQGALKILNNRWYVYLFGKFTALMEKLNLYMTTNDYEKMKEIIDTVIDGSFSKKEKNYVASNSFFFFVDQKDKQYCKKLLDCLRKTAEIDEYEFDTLLYRFLVEESATENDVEHLTEMMEMLKPSQDKNKVQMGMMQYMLGTYYLKHNEKKKAESYLNKAKLNLKQTPYHSKIKEML
ncbi:MAG: hypothetical protein ACI4WG_03560 [Erysipelotrichaceae bacterium]